MYGLVVIEVMTPSGHLSNIDEMPLGGAKDELFSWFCEFLCFAIPRKCKQKYAVGRFLYT
jgi:hypothetical protein